MIRSARLVLLVWIACLMIGSRTAAAQAQPGGPGQSESRFSVEFVGAATFGHRVSGSLGGEFDYRWTDAFDLFFESGHMFDVTTRDVEDRATRVAAFINGSPATSRHAEYFDFGIKYRFPVFFGSGFFTKWVPYVGVGAGFAQVKNRTTFAVNGVDVTGQLLDVYGVELGNDLADSVTKGAFVFSLGAQRSLSRRYFVDASYRYGHIFSSGKIVDDTGTNTNRLQAGFGVRF